MSVILRFHGELKDHAGAEYVPRAMVVPGSVKDTIEACGVPHTEVGAIFVNGARVELGALVRDGDRVDVHAAEMSGSR